jgi:hypothetical protein
MRHRTVHLSSPTVCRSRFRPVRRSGAATSAANHADRTPVGARVARNVAADGALIFDYEVPVP